jgi:hypothetical protein
MSSDQPFSGLDMDHSEGSGNWSGGSLALYLAVTSLYWASTWFASGLPPLTALANRFQTRSERM